MIAAGMISESLRGVKACKKLIFNYSVFCFCLLCVCIQNTA